MQQELDIEDLEVTVDPAPCLELARSPGAMVKATVKTVSDIVLVILNHM